MPTTASLEGDSMPLKWNPLGLGNLVLFVFFSPAVFQRISSSSVNLTVWLPGPQVPLLLSYDRPGMWLHVPSGCFSDCNPAPRPPRGLLALAPRFWDYQWYCQGVVSE